MTEIKYIFPKQLQSVAALAFIAVLIALLLILTVMVHMRNRKLKRMLRRWAGGPTQSPTACSIAVRTLCRSVRREGE